MRANLPGCVIRLSLLPQRGLRFLWQSRGSKYGLSAVFVDVRELAPALADEARLSDLLKQLAPDEQLRHENRLPVALLATLAASKSGCSPRQQRALWARLVSSRENNNVQHPSALVCLDSYDMIDFAAQNDLKTSLRYSESTGARVLLGTREANYDANPLPSAASRSWTEYEITGLSPPEKERLIHNYFKADQQLADTLITAITNSAPTVFGSGTVVIHPALCDTDIAGCSRPAVTRCPILTGACLSPRRGGTIRRNKDLTYLSGLKQWDNHKVRAEKLLDLLGEIALEFYGVPTIGKMSLDRFLNIEKTIAGRTRCVLEYYGLPRHTLVASELVADGLLIETSQDHYQFLHPNIQEYLTSRILAARATRSAGKRFRVKSTAFPGGRSGKNRSSCWLANFQTRLL